VFICAYFFIVCVEIYMSNCVEENVSCWTHQCVLLLVAEVCLMGLFSHGCHVQTLRFQLRPVLNVWPFFKQRFIADHFSGTGRAVGPLCVCLCVQT